MCLRGTVIAHRKAQFSLGDADHSRADLVNPEDSGVTGANGKAVPIGPTDLGSLTDKGAKGRSTDFTRLQGGILIDFQRKGLPGRNDDFHGHEGGLSEQKRLPAGRIEQMHMVQRDGDTDSIVRGGALVCRDLSDQLMRTKPQVQ